jgi:hypothetical protein
MSLSFFDKTTPLAVNEKTAERLIKAMKKKNLLEFAKQHPVRVEHFLGRPLLEAAQHGYLDQIGEVLKLSGGHLTPEHFLAESAQVNSPLTTARLHRHLDQVFAPALWVCRVGEMERLWKRVNPLYRKAVDYEALRNRAILMSVRTAPKISLSDFEGVRRPTASYAEKSEALAVRSRV